MMFFFLFSLEECSVIAIINDEIRRENSSGSAKWNTFRLLCGQTDDFERKNSQLDGVIVN